MTDSDGDHEKKSRRLAVIHRELQNQPATGDAQAMDVKEEVRVIRVAMTAVDVRVILQLIVQPIEYLEHRLSPENE